PWLLLRAPIRTSVAMPRRRSKCQSTIVRGRQLLWSGCRRQATATICATRRTFARVCSVEETTDQSEFPESHDCVLRSPRVLRLVATTGKRNIARTTRVRSLFEKLCQVSALLFSDL